MHFLVKNIYFGYVYDASFWVLAQASSTHLSKYDMIPNRLEVEPMKDTPLFNKIWRGTQVESAARFKKEKSATTRKRQEKRDTGLQAQPLQTEQTELSNSSNRSRPYKMSDFAPIGGFVPEDHDQDLAPIPGPDQNEDQEEDDDFEEQDLLEEEQDNSDSCNSGIEDGLGLEESIATAMALFESESGDAGGMEGEGVDEDVPALPGEDADLREVIDLKTPRASRVSEVRIDFEGSQLRYNISTEFIRAHCPIHDCSRQRSTRPSDSKTRKAQGQGRCLGALVQWLREAASFDSKDLHMKAPIASYNLRKAARDEFMKVPGAKDFATYERPCREGEGEEPTEIR